MKSVIKLAGGLLAALVLSAPLAVAQDAPKQVLFTNVHVFDGVKKERIENANVLVQGNKIKSVSTEAISAPGAEVIDGGGRTLLPGFIEAHAHLMLMGPSLPAMEANTTWEDFAIHGTRMAEMYRCRASRRYAMRVEATEDCVALSTRDRFPDRATTRQVLS